MRSDISINVFAVAYKVESGHRNSERSPVRPSMRLSVRQGFRPLAIK